MAQIVLIHGIGQQASTVQEQEAAWLPSLVKGVLASGHPEAAAVAARVAASTGQNRPPLARMAFYGDLYLPTGTQGRRPRHRPQPRPSPTTSRPPCWPAPPSAMTPGWQPRRPTRCARPIPIAMASRVWVPAPAARSPCWTVTPG